MCDGGYYSSLLPDIPAKCASPWPVILLRAAMAPWTTHGFPFPSGPLIRIGEVLATFIHPSCSSRSHVPASLDFCTKFTSCEQRTRIFSCGDTSPPTSFALFDRSTSLAFPILGSWPITCCKGCSAVVSSEERCRWRLHSCTTRNHSRRRSCFRHRTRRLRSRRLPTST